MTAEIAIMNKGSIALAADSAVTVQKGGGPKIYNTVNKLFALSKHQPVGVMVYGTPEFVGVPWETIIKEYRRKLHRRRFLKLDEYANDFLRFLEGSATLFPISEKDDYFRRHLYSFLTSLKNTIDEKVRKTITDNGKISEEQVRATTADAIGKKCEALRRLKTLPCFRGVSPASAVKRYGALIGKVKNNVFEKLPITTDELRMLNRIAGYLLIKPQWSPTYSGVVIAGFGSAQHFPSIVSIRVDGFLNGRLKYLRLSHEAINGRNSATIVPFAQSEMVHTFMEGIDPVYQNFLDAYLKKLFSRLPREIVGSLGDFGTKSARQVGAKLEVSCKSLLEEFKRDSVAHRRKKHVDPVINAVAFLPKDELAAMAEALVNLTSFKRRITLDAETVGGPIDVALISKGDGFIWIKRKHYFDPKLNPGFFANYYQDSPKGRGDAEKGQGQ